MFVVVVGDVSGAASTATTRAGARPTCAASRVFRCRYVTALGEPVDHERVQRVGVRDAHVEEEVASAGDDEDAHDLGQVGGPVAESFDVLAGRGTDRDGDQGLDVASERVHR
jgi:hypothetical protein